MFESYIAEMDVRARALKMLLLLLESQIENNMINYHEENSYKKDADSLAIIHALKLLLKDVFKLKDEYYKDFVKEEYGE